MVERRKDIIRDILIVCVTSFVLILLIFLFKKTPDSVKTIESIGLPLSAVETLKNLLKP